MVDDIVTLYSFIFYTYISNDWSISQAQNILSSIWLLLLLRYNTIQYKDVKRAEKGSSIGICNEEELPKRNILSCHTNTKTDTCIIYIYTYIHSNSSVDTLIQTQTVTSISKPSRMFFMLDTHTLQLTGSISFYFSFSIFNRYHHLKTNCKIRLMITDVHNTSIHNLWRHISLSYLISSLFIFICINPPHKTHHLQNNQSQNG